MPGSPNSAIELLPNPCLAAVVFDLLHDRLGVFRTVDAHEDFPDHGLLVGSEEVAECLVRDVPVVVHLRAQRMIERENNGLLLLLGQAFEKRGHECLRPGAFGRGGLRVGEGDERRGTGRSHSHGRCLEKRPAVDRAATLAEIEGRVRFHGARLAFLWSLFQLLNLLRVRPRRAPRLVAMAMILWCIGGIDAKQVVQRHCELKKQPMSTNTATKDTLVIQKTKELCQTIVNQPEFQNIRRRIDTFLANDDAKNQYQAVVEKGGLLQHKQQQGLPLSNDEISDFEKQREALVCNPIARDFLDAQEEMQKVQQSVGQYVAKTFELGRPPTEEDFSSGCCDSGCGCH